MKRKNKNKKLKKYNHHSNKKKSKISLGKKNLDPTLTVTCYKYISR